MIIPAKHILFCDFAGHKFREEIDASQVGDSFKDYSSYYDKLNECIDRILIKQDIEKFMDGHYYDSQVKAGCHFVYSDILRKVVKERPWGYPIIRLDAIRQDGSIIYANEEEHIEEFFKRHPEYYQKPYVFKSANEYISISIKNFVKEGCWQFAFHSGDKYDEYIDGLDDPANWLSPKEDGTWRDEDDGIWYPRMWFGLNSRQPENIWVLDGSNIGFWFNKAKDSDFIEYDKTDHVGCYNDSLPDMKPIRQKCPISFSADDTVESIKAKIQKFFAERYKIVQETPAKHALYCNYPGLEFREEIKDSEIEYSYEDEFGSYSDVLYDFIVDVLINLDLEKFMDSFFTGDNVRASGHICYDEVRTETFGDAEISINKNIKVYLDSIREDGTVIETKEINIEDYVDLESEKERLMECGFWGDTDDYIETALGNFVDTSSWHFGLYKDGQYIEEVAKWPALQKNGSWVDDDGEVMVPCVWFGNGSDQWDLDEDNLEFWQTGNPHGTVVEYVYDAFAGCYGGDIPGFDEVVKSCPVAINDKDTPESIEKKIQEFFIKEYKKVHT